MTAGMSGMPLWIIGLLALGLFGFGIGWSMAFRIDEEPLLRGERIADRRVTNHDGKGEASSQDRLPVDEQTARRWTTYDLVSGLSGMHDPEDRERTADRIMAMMNKDPHETMARFGELPEGHRGAGFLPFILVPFLQHQDVEVAFELISHLKGNDELFSSMLNYWAPGVAHESPENDSRLLDWMSSVADDPRASQAAAGAAVEMVRRDELSVTKLREVWGRAQSLPDGELRQLVMSECLGAYYPDKIDEVKEIVGELPVSSENDTIFRDYAETLSMTDPVEALDWVAVIEDPSLRKMGYETIVRNWAVEDRAELETWMRENNPMFTDEQIEGLNMVLEQSDLHKIIELYPEEVPGEAP